MTDENLNDQVRPLVNRAVKSGFDAADQATLASMLHSASGSEIAPLIDEFFDFEPIPLGLFAEFVERGANWDSDVRTKLVEALFFCGRDDEADRVQQAAT